MKTPQKFEDPFSVVHKKVNEIISFLEEKFPDYSRDGVVVVSPQSDEPKKVGCCALCRQKNFRFPNGCQNNSCPCHTKPDEPKCCIQCIDHSVDNKDYCGYPSCPCHTQSDEPKGKCNKPTWQSPNLSGNPTGEYDFLKKQKDEILKDKQTKVESDYAAIWENYFDENSHCLIGGVRQDILELMRKVAK